MRFTSFLPLYSPCLVEMLAATLAQPSPTPSFLNSYSFLFSASIFSSLRTSSSLAFVALNCSNCILPASLRLSFAWCSSSCLSKWVQFWLWVSLWWILPTHEFVWQSRLLLEWALRSRCSQGQIRVLYGRQNTVHELKLVIRSIIIRLIVIGSAKLVVVRGT